jgi:uridylate kinase
MKKTQEKQNNTEGLGSNKTIKYHRLLLKISGEILGSGKMLFSQKAFDYIIEQVIETCRIGAKISIVIGGGNLIRGRDISWFNNIDADMCGMLATVINGIIIQSQLQKNGISTKLSSGLEIPGIVKRSNKFEDLAFYNSGGVIVYVGGTGNPLFTTDTAAALRAAELNADILVKATKVEGIYSNDPIKDSTAKLYKILTFQKAIDEKLGIMDLTAFNICRKTNIPIYVYNFMKHSLTGVIKGEKIGTLVTNGV